MNRLKKVALAVAIVLVLVIAFITFALPGIIVNKAAEAIKANYGRTLTVGKLTINPFTGKVEARGIRLTEPRNAAVFFSCSTARAKISPASLYHRAPVISSIDIISPYVHIIRLNSSTYNFSDFIPKGEKKKDEGNPAHFSLNNIWLRQGNIDFTDRLLSQAQEHTVRKLEIRIPFISNLPYLADTYITPGMSAVANGSPFSLEGKLKPFAKHVEVDVDIRLKGLNLPKYASYLPDTVPIKVVSGEMNTDLQIIHRAVATGKPAFIVTGTARLSHLEMHDRLDAPLLALAEGSVKIKEAQLLAGTFDINAVELTGPVLRVSRDRQGVLNLAKLVAPHQETQESARPLQQKIKESVKKGMEARKTQQIVVTVASTRLTKGEVHFSDAQPPGGFTLDLDGITLAVDGFSNQPDKQATYTLACATQRKERVDLSGTFSVAPVAATSKAAVSGLVLEALYPYLAGVLTAPVEGRLDASAEVGYTADTGPQVTNGALKLKNLGVRFGDKDGVRIPEITLTGGTVDLKARKATVAGIAVKGGRVAVSRLKGGSLSPLALLKTPPPPAAPAAPAAKKAPSPAPPFRFAVKQIGVKGVDLSFADYQKDPAATFDLNKISLTLANVSGPGPATIPYTLAAGYDDGSIRSRGTLGTEPVRINGTCALTGIPITDFEDYFPPDLHIVIADGLLDTDLKLNLTLAKEGPTGSFTGNMAVRRFHSMDDVQGDDLLTWKDLHLEGINGGLNPFSLKLTQVALTDFFARFTIEQDATLNLQKIYGKPAGAPTATATATPPPASPPPSAAAPPAMAPATPPKKIAIDAVTMQGGNIIFTDNHIRPRFSATMYQVGGRISGLSSEHSSLADVDLRGNLRNQSPLSITGKINPLRGDLYVDMKVSFADIELSPLSPYSGTYLGYTVEKGKLFLDLIYKIDHKQLDSQNKVFIDQLTFGDKVESDKATKLPVRLAVALLKDANGEIHLDMPVTGRTDDPQFSVWKVIGQILMNLLEKAATAPFKLLGSLFSGGENFNSIDFSPGSAQLAAGEQQKLLKLGSALANRPALKLEITGFVDRERDPEGYRQVLLTRKMQSEKYQALVKAKKLPSGQTAETLEIAPDEYSQLLTAVYKKEKFPKPRNFIGMAKDLPDPEMKKLIFANTVVGDQELHVLARERLVTVKNFLIDKAKVDRARLFEKTGDIYKPPEEKGTPASRVEFGLAAQ